MYGAVPYKIMKSHHALASFMWYASELQALCHGLVTNHDTIGKQTTDHSSMNHLQPILHLT
jgi:hypothetical protein